MTSSQELIINYLRNLERIDGIIANTHLAEQTSLEIVKHGYDEILAVSRKINIPIKKGTQAMLINLPNQGLAVGEFLVAELAFSYRYVHTQYGGSHTRYNARPNLDEFDDDNALMAAFDTQTDIYNTISNSLQPHTSDQEWRSYNYHFGEIEGFFTEGARPKNASFLRPLPNNTVADRKSVV